MGLFKKSNDVQAFIDYIINQNEIQLSVKYRAIDKAIDLLSRTLALTTLDTYKKKNNKIQEVKEDLFYKLNIKPNNNEYAYNFWYKCWNKFFYEKEVLLFSLNNKLYVADDFDVNDNVIVEKIYSNIKLETENGIYFELEQTFNATEVIHIKLTNQKTLDFLENFYNDLGNLILVSNEYYRDSNIIKWILGTPGNQVPLKDAKTGNDISYETYKEKLAGSLLANKKSILMLSKHFSLDKIQSEKNVTSEDYRNLIKSWEESVADSFLIPRDIYFGNKTDKSSSDNDYLTYAIKPYLSLLEDGLNAIVIKKDDYLKGERIKADIHSIKVHDIITNANSLDKLYSDGFSHNDVRKFVDLVEIDEDWANEHRITKNYSEDVSSNKKKGGD